MGFVIPTEKAYQIYNKLDDKYSTGYVAHSTGNIELETVLEKDSMAKAVSETDWIQWHCLG